MRHLIYNSRNSKDLIVIYSYIPPSRLYNSRNSKDLIVNIEVLGEAWLSTTVEIQKT